MGTYFANAMAQLFQQRGQYIGCLLSKSMPTAAVMRMQREWRGVARCDTDGNAIARCDWHGNAIARCDWRGNARSLTSFDAQCCDAEEYTMEL